MKAALLLIDLQRDYLTMSGLQPPAHVLITHAAALLEGCRRRRVPVIHIWTTLHRHRDERLPHWRRAGRWICVEGTVGHTPPDSLRPSEGEPVIHKKGFNAFADGELDAALQRMGCDTVILAGLHLHACVRTAVVECLERGHQVHIADDATASNDPAHAAATHRWLAERCVTFEPAAAILARMDDAPSALVHRSPRCTGEVLFEVPIADAGEITAAVATAREAGQNWRRTSRPERQRLLNATAERLDAAAPDLARQMALEIGKPVSHGLEEVHRAAANIRDVVCRAAARPLQKHEAAGVVQYRPLGVAALITAWNNPVAIALGKIAPALAYGNTVVWKPAPAATRIAEMVLRLLREADIPTHTVNLLTGDQTTARQLATNAGIDAVTITGSVLSGYAMQEICARRMVPLQAELSGNNAAIVWDDTDLYQAAEQIAWGAFAFAGQRCTANRRVIVPASQFENVLRELEVAANRLPWGDPLDRTIETGPVINTARRDEIAALIDYVQADGAAHRVVLLHADKAEQPWVKAGAYARPAIVCCDRPDHPLVQEETMGPLLVVQRAADFEHAIELCNGVRHGLVAALFSTSHERQRQFAEQAEAGVLKFNASTAGVDPTLPLGGWKASGIGPPEHGEGDHLFYTRIQAIYGETEA